MHKYLRIASHYSVKGHPGRRAFVGSIGIRSDGTIVSAHNGRADIVQRGIHADVGLIAATRNHAEARLVRKLDKGSVVFVARTRRDTGETVMAKPCKNCYNTMRNHGVLKCYYTISHNEYGIIEF